MPRDMFGDVTSPSVKIGNRKWYTVPVSLGSHLLIVAAIALIPILAPALLPIPDTDIPYIIHAIKMPDPPPPPRRVEPQPVTPVANPNAAPIEAPKGITPEAPLQAGFENDQRLDSIIVGDPSAGDVIVAPPKPAAPTEPLRVGGIIKTPVKIAGDSPVYPDLAQRVRKQGMVIIEATIDVDGNVINARVLRSEPLLDQAALDAVKTWRYTPTLLNGIPVAVVMTVVVQFQLQ